MKQKTIAVIGGGSAGLTAARTAHELGAKVLFFMGDNADRASLVNRPTVLVALESLWADVGREVVPATAVRQVVTTNELDLLPGAAPPLASDR